MSHLGEEALILLHYGEGDGLEADRVHVESCLRCQAALDALERDLEDVGEMPTPERGSDYGAGVYERIEPRLTRGRSRWRPVWMSAAAAVILFGTFLAGRFSHDAGPSVSQEGLRERVLFVAIGDHLDRSQMLLLEVMNAEHGDDERSTARELLKESRLYRASGTGVIDVPTTEVLDELERLLLDVAHRASPDDVLRSRINDQDVLFKIRILQTAVRERERRNAITDF